VRPRLVVVGDALLDRDLVGSVARVSPDAPVPVLDEQSATWRPGGAGLAALLAAAESTVDVTLVTAVAADPDGDRLRELLEPAVTLVAVPAGGGTPVKTRVRAAGQSLLRIDRGGAPGPVTVTDAALSAVDGADAVLVADYGRGLTADPALRAALASAARRVPVLWDPHPRGADPVPGCRLVTPNLAEAAALTGRALSPGGYGEIGAAGADLTHRWQAAAVAVTLGAAGALLSFGTGTPLVVPAPRVSTSDTCGAGDRFAAAAATALASGRLPSDAVTAAVLAAADFVAAGAAAALRPEALRPEAPRSDGARSEAPRSAPAGTAVPAARTAGDPPGTDGSAGDAVRLAERVRAAGGTVVGTGGCFDLLHAGHVSLLSAARRLGDCLIVCLNSDDSVRRLKGPDRPVVGQHDRAELLRALSCVDATVVFAEDDPSAVLERIRPHLWVKGGDYTAAELPEQRVLSGWGGQAVVLPYLTGYSTTNLVKHVREELT
jgi:D-beta-D-heptose 7-phosphate kinase/D-beta-D-heptose 1-phosphate adenosyltransferase